MKYAILYWKVKEHVIEEGKKYKNRKAFSEGSYSAWRSAKDNGWIDEIFPPKKK